MTEIQFPLDEPAVTRRGHLQRRLRRQRETARRDAAIGAVIAALLVTTLDSGALLAVVAASADDAAPSELSQHGEADPSADAVFTASMVGDLMFGRHVERVVERHGADALLADVAPLLTGDYVSGNLEQVISEQDDLPEANKLIHLVSDRRAVDALVAAGFTTLSLANNHSMDHGIPGLRDTIEALDEAGLQHAGGGLDLAAAVETNYQEFGGLTVATLSFTDAYVQGFIARAFQGGVLEAEPEVFIPLLQQASQNADLVIANFHWGEEYDFGPNRRQRELAEIAAAAGADIIIGHHPHVVMPVERIGDTLVFYSLGNFVFDQGWSRTRESVIARYSLGEDGMARVTLVPVYITEGTPRAVSGPLGVYRRERIFQRLRGGDGIEWRREGDHLVADLDHRHVVEGVTP